jgi:hypothetical protein
LNKKEASALLDLIQLELGVKAAKMHLLGNERTWVVIVHHQYHCWELSDWHKYKTNVLEYPKQKVAV